MPTIWILENSKMGEDFFIQRPNNLLAPQRASAFTTAVNSGRAGFPAIINNLSADELRALGRLAMRSDILTGRLDSIWRSAKLPPPTIYVPKDGLLGSDVIIRKTTESGEEAFNIYWDVRVDRSTVRVASGIPEVTSARTHPEKMATYDSLDDLIDAINSRTFPASNEGADIKKALIARGYARGDRLDKNELLFSETQSTPLLSWREYESIWSTLRVSYNALGANASKNTILREAMVRFGKTLINKIFTANNTPQASPETKRAAAEQILAFWETSKALRSAPNTPPAHEFEARYDNWVRGLISVLDKDALENILRGEAAEIMNRVRENIAKETTPDGMEARRGEGERELAELERRAAEQGLSGVTDKEKDELEDYKKIIRIYRDTADAAPRARNQNDFNNTIKNGKDAIDNALRDPATAQGREKYPSDAPIKKLAEDLKRRLDGIKPPRAPQRTAEQIAAERARQEEEARRAQEAREAERNREIESARESLFNQRRRALSNISSYFDTGNNANIAAKYLGYLQNKSSFNRFIQSYLNKPENAGKTYRDAMSVLAEHISGLISAQERGVAYDEKPVL
ncbi:MAG: hypothetical protein LBD99_03720 [Candidatus Margulisbacteria bacterium]|nr:hypothetical protein [Candidatus Margulisiibacteriota bacterium]